MAEHQAKRQKTTEAVPAAEVITFHMLKNTPEGPAIEENGSFNPELTHQLFGEEEEIRGYDGLSIDIFVTPRLQPLVDVKYASKAKNATDLRSPFVNVFAAGFFERKEEFDAALRAEAPLPLGALGEQVLEAPTAEGSQLLVTFSKLSEASPELKELHARAQAFLYFFVDAASAIDPEDPQWDVYLALERSPDGVEFLGFATVYKFFAYPDTCRLRLSQILVMPQHQGRGVGSLLLKAIYKQAEEMKAVDVTFEDPSEALQRIRDRLDLQRMARCEWLQEAASHAVSTVAATTGGSEEDDESAGAAAAKELELSAGELARAQKELRATKQQVKRVWDALLLLLGSQLPQKDRVEAAVEAAILRRTQAQVAAAKKGAAGKAVKETEGGWVMARWSKPGQGSSGAAAPPQPGGAPVEGVTPEQQEEAIEQMVSGRMEELQAVVASLTGAGASGRQS